MNMNTQNLAGTITINPAHITSDMMSDGMSGPSSPESEPFDPTDLLTADDVTSQLAASGTVGIAAAAAIATGKKRKRPHMFETNPSNRKRQQTRLLRKLKMAIEEFTTRVGQQAVIVCCTPGKGTKSVQSFKVFGSQPLESVMRNCRNMILQDLETALAEQVMPQMENSSIHDLPPLCIDGIPTPVDKMTQAQLRAFIPLMLKYSTGRGKPGWGKPEHRPIWWPEDLPWANVRSDARTEEQKQKVSWTEALRTIVKNCYKNHGREDLLHIFNDEGTSTQQAQPQYAAAMNGTLLQTVNNPDGSVSIIQIDTTTPGSVVTLPDGTQATVVHAQVHSSQQQQQQQETAQAVHTLADGSIAQGDQVHMNSLSLDMTDSHAQQAVALHGASLGQDHQLVLTGDTNLCATDSGVVTIPVSLYQLVHPNVNLSGSQLAQSQPGMHLSTCKDTSSMSLQPVEVMSVSQTGDT
ncbi:DNA-binding protein P3A2-like [Haliotis rufescens]|uniref:DNA-binding protein P3A2-like n=1 Tax=Haliotis rufescens TaxID=6454 RepID=UPI001EAFA630|nr:DNA-binding protein P3A2-like [Haliotis rufescens]XP_046334754.1 DNA-binding protein P3A2-like [Haliotis rufescens]XP_046334755.1 DNA-binding protein P3A2-like [Haliotis rufescens]XP_046334756.1 DNA-binding protein P3A2-like [Haliotis rufescens]